MRPRSERRVVRYLAWAELVRRRGLCDPRPRPGPSLYLTSSTSPILTGLSTETTIKGKGTVPSWSFWRLRLLAVRWLLEWSGPDEPAGSVAESGRTRAKRTETSQPAPDLVRVQAWVLILQDIPHPNPPSFLIIIIQPQPTLRTNHNSNFPS